MDDRIVFSLGTLYVFVYHILGRYLVNRVTSIEARGSLVSGKSRYLGRTSVFSVIFDDDMPDMVNSKKLSIIFYIVKGMLIASPLIYTILFSLIFLSPE